MQKETLLEIIRIQNEIVAAGLSSENVMSLAVSELPRLVPSAAGAIVEMRDADDMVYRAASGCAEPFAGLRLPAAGTLSGLCVTTGQALYSADTEHDSRVDRGAARRVGARSMICHPLIHGNKCIGALKAVSHRPHAFSESDMHVLSLVSSIIAASIHHAALFETARREARTDALTRLGNRRAFDNDLAVLCERACAGAGLTVVLFDLDNLKAINDVYGHSAGDLLLQTFSAILSVNTRSSDAAYRVGGDEYVVLMPECTAFQAGLLIARIMQALSGAEIAHTTIEFSYGVAEFAPGDTPESLMRRADDAMYANKGTGRRSTTNV